MKSIAEVDESMIDDIELSPSKRSLLQTFSKQSCLPWQKQNIPEKSALKLITKTNSRISTLNGELVEKIEIRPEDVNARNSIQNQWKKIKNYQHFIQEVLFETGLVDRLIDDFQGMLEIAYQKHLERKEMKEGKVVEIGIGTSGDDGMYDSKEKQLSGVMKKKTSYSSQNSEKKKVMVSSQNSSQTSEAHAHQRTDIPESLQILIQQNIFKKYCFNKYKIQNIHVSFSKNFKFFTYKVEGKDQQLVEPMGELVEVILGRSTKNFKKYLKKGEEGEDFVSFSLVFTKRTYDLQADTPETRTKFVAGISEIMNMSDYKK